RLPGAAARARRRRGDDGARGLAPRPQARRPAAPPRRPERHRSAARRARGDALRSPPARAAAGDRRPRVTLGKRLVVSGDDFGVAVEVNEGILRAHRDGILGQTSLMVAGDAVEHAVALARATPTLAVGLHLVLAQGRPAAAARD